MQRRQRIFCFLGALIGFAFPLHAGSTNQPLVTLELKDGSRVIGRCDTDKLAFHSQILGDIHLGLEQVASVEFSRETNVVKLVTTNGDTLTAEPVTREIQIETSFGKIRIPAASLRRLLVTDKVHSEMTKAGLVALWSGEDNGNDSAGGNQAFLVGPLGYSHGKRGEGFFFGGNNAYLIVHPGESLDVGRGNGFTFECWIKPGTVDADMLIFEFERALGTANGSDVGMELAIHQRTLDGEGTGCLYANIKDVDDASHMFTSPPNMLAPGRWQHVALTYDKNTGEGVIYLNGAVAAHANLGAFTPQTSFPNLLLGAKTTYNSEMNPGNLYVGGLDEFGIYNRALSEEEIREVYTDEGAGAASN